MQPNLKEACMNENKVKNLCTFSVFDTTGGCEIDWKLENSMLGNIRSGRTLWGLKAQPLDGRLGMKSRKSATRGKKHLAIFLKVGDILRRLFETF